jgi:hypothetical protein
MTTRRCAHAAALLPALLFPAAAAAPFPPGPDTPAAQALREEQEKLSALLEALAKRSETYRAAMLRFLCDETLIRSEFDTKDGHRQSEQVVKSDYLLARGRSGELVERRRVTHGRPGAGWDGSLPRQPLPYQWTLMFTPYYQKLFNFRLAGQEVVHFRLATVIEFSAILPFTDGSTITQWAGRAYVDAETLDLLRIEAEPPSQEMKLDQEQDRYRRSMRLANLPLRRRPRAHEHEVDFNYVKEQLRLPGLAITRRYVVPDADSRALQSQTLQIFADYRLFRVETDERLKAIRDSAPPP